MSAAKLRAAKSHASMKNKISLFNVGLVLAVCLGTFIVARSQPKSFIGDLDAIAKRRGQTIVFQIAQAVLYYKKENQDAYPQKLADLSPLYLETSSLLGSTIEEWLKISGTDMILWPEALDLTGFASIYPHSNGEFMVILSPTLYGSEAVPFFHYVPSKHPTDGIDYYKMDYQLINLTEACRLVRMTRGRMNESDNRGVLPPVPPSH